MRLNNYSFSFFFFSMREEIKVHHYAWQDYLIIGPDEKYYRKDNPDEKAVCKFEKNILFITWDKWGEELFFFDSNQDCYFYLNEKYCLFYPHIFQQIFIETNDWKESCIISDDCSFIFRSESQTEYGSFTLDKNRLDIQWKKWGKEEFIFFQDHWIEKNFLFKKFNYILIINSYNDSVIEEINRLRESIKEIIFKTNNEPINSSKKEIKNFSDLTTVCKKKNYDNKNDDLEQEKIKQSIIIKIYEEVYISLKNYISEYFINKDNNDTYVLEKNKSLKYNKCFQYKNSLFLIDLVSEKCDSFTKIDELYMPFLIIEKELLKKYNCTDKKICIVGDNKENIILLDDERSFRKNDKILDYVFNEGKELLVIEKFIPIQVGGNIKYLSKLDFDKYVKKINIVSDEVNEFESDSESIFGLMTKTVYYHTEWNIFFNEDFIETDTYYVKTDFDNSKTIFLNTEDKYSYYSHTKDNNYYNSLETFIKHRFDGMNHLFCFINCFEIDEKKMNYLFLLEKKFRLNLVFLIYSDSENNLTVQYILLKKIFDEYEFYKFIYNPSWTYSMQSICFENKNLLLNNKNSYFFFDLYDKKNDLIYYEYDSLDKSNRLIGNKENIFYEKSIEWIEKFPKKCFGYDSKIPNYNFHTLFSEYKDKWEGSSFFEEWSRLNQEHPLYSTIFKKLLNLEGERKIPKIFHFIWIGKEQLPIVYQDYFESWIKGHPDYIFCFWNDDNIPKLVYQELYDKSSRYAMKADILRYELLTIFGGVYVDCDFLCCKNIDCIINDKKGFSAYESDDYIAIGIMGFMKQHPFLLKLLNVIPFHLELFKEEKYIPLLTGPVFFTHIWKQYLENNILDEKDLFAFNPETFYEYTYEDKIIHKRIEIDESKEYQYAIHTWGHSWSDDKLQNQMVFKKSFKNIIQTLMENNNLVIFCPENYCSFFIKEDILNIKNNKNYDSELFNSELFDSELFNSEKDISNSNYRKKIVHIIGVFYSGGIERLCYYFDKYGNHDLYEMVLCYIGMDKVFYVINQMQMIDYRGDMEALNNFLIDFKPDLIIDHCSIYLNENNTMYKNIDTNKVLTFVHSAICYKKDISNENLIIKKCIHLYDEKDKHSSWVEKVLENKYVMLGAEMLSDEDSKNMTKKYIDKSDKSNKKLLTKRKFKIGMIGRVCNEKMPFSFLEKCIKFTNKHKKFEVLIYGEKKNPFELDYEKKFDKMIEGTKIKYMGFVEPDSINKVYSDIDILIIPSVYETGSFVCVEAFAFGIPVMARNVYGLKYLIENDKNGYLCNEDEDFFEKLKDINLTKLEEMQKYIFKNCQYDIVDKIFDMENIFENEIEIIKDKSVCFIKEKKQNSDNEVIKKIDFNDLITQKEEDYNKTNQGEKNHNQVKQEKNIFLITSIITPCENPLSYYFLRSVFTPEQRYIQTLKSINSIRNYYPDAVIYWIEGSFVEESFEKEIKQKVEYYLNVYEENKDELNSEFKGLGERILILKGLEYIFEQQKEKDFSFNLYKLSGRYYLNNEFDVNQFKSSGKSTFKMWEDHKSFTSIFYKIVSKDILFFYQILSEGYDFLSRGKSMEECLYKGFFINTFDHIHNVDKCNVSGYLSTEGYFFKV